ncbi:hypothetical protein NDU88_000094 [Pleurodeles waltl]|uniref:Uncharacterized protein n=1 Tax=Pleurodeles waltl TaxID=8319 RepID=A0AAV7S5W6_PLEWA|nr:hypothetical protein NDU88_000094 [Pleurodeles waltl]
MRSKGGTIYMDEVPKLPSGLVATDDSLINKVIYWLRVQCNCLSVIRADILEVGRHSQHGSNFDVISICFADKLLVDKPMDCESRTSYLRDLSGVGIKVVSHAPAANPSLLLDGLASIQKCALAPVAKFSHIPSAID